MAMDPVCNMEVDEATAQWTSEYKGNMYYFCAPGCKASFDEDPEKSRQFPTLRIANYPENLYK